MDESYHNSRYVWAHGEFTPQQTMRGKSQWHTIENLETLGATIRVPRPGVYSVSLRNKGSHLTLPKVFY